MDKKTKKMFTDYSHMKVIIEKLLSYGGFDIEKFNFAKEWYLKYTWGKEEEQDFRKWLLAYLKKEKGAWNDLVEFPSLKTPAHMKRVVDMVVFQWGWKSK